MSTIEKLAVTQYLILAMGLSDSADIFVFCSIIERNNRLARLMLFFVSFFVSFVGNTKITF